MEFLLGGHSPAPSPALVQGARPFRSPAPRAVVPGGRVSAGMAVSGWHLLTAALPAVVDSLPKDAEEKNGALFQSQVHQ